VNYELVETTILAQANLWRIVGRIREHLAEKIDELVAGGMSREEATYAARREFGNVNLVEENGRDVLALAIDRIPSR